MGGNKRCRGGPHRRQANRAANLHEEGRVGERHSAGAGSRRRAPRGHMGGNSRRSKPAAGRAREYFHISRWTWRRPGAVRAARARWWSLGRDTPRGDAMEGWPRHNFDRRTRTGQRPGWSDAGGFRRRSFYRDVRRSVTVACRRIEELWSCRWLAEQHDNDTRSQPERRFLGRHQRSGIGAMGRLEVLQLRGIAGDPTPNLRSAGRWFRVVVAIVEPWNIPDLHCRVDKLPPRPEERGRSRAVRPGRRIAADRPRRRGLSFGLEIERRKACFR